MAFSAFIPGGRTIAASDGATVPFHGLITNVGLAYHPATAVFTCPSDGDYFFSISVDVSHDYEYLWLQKNGVNVASADKDDSVSTHLTASVVLSLKAGDVVTVNQGHTSGYLDTGTDCTFTGFLVR